MFERLTWALWYLSKIVLVFFVAFLLFNIDVFCLCMITFSKCILNQCKVQYLLLYHISMCFKDSAFRFYLVICLINKYVLDDSLVTFLILNIIQLFNVITQLKIVGEKQNLNNNFKWFSLLTKHPQVVNWQCPTFFLNIYTLIFI